MANCAQGQGKKARRHPRPTRRAAAVVSVCVLVLPGALLLATWTCPAQLVAWWDVGFALGGGGSALRHGDRGSPGGSSAHGDVRRRGLLPGLAILVGGGEASHAAPTAEELDAEFAKEDEQACKCCSSDWCGCKGCTNCYKALKTQGYALPLDAQAAYKKAGGRGWPLALNWQATFPKLPGVARVATAESFQVSKSNIENAGDGLFTNTALPRGSVLPPYQGEVLNFAKGQKGGAYVWCPVSAGLRMYFAEEGETETGGMAEEPSFCVDSAGTKEGNPARFVNGAGSKDECKEVNLEICEIGDIMYFRTSRDVPVGAELLTDYGDFYWSNNEPC